MTEEKLNGGCTHSKPIWRRCCKNTRLQDVASDFPQEQVEPQRL